MRQNFTRIAMDGSPPRPWGRQVERVVNRRDDRFTPTPVGTTIVCLENYCLNTVHPHARGDDVFAVPLPLPFHGSPPRPWGRRAPFLAARLSSRFTPTPVGTTLRSTLTACRCTVHPHARGDDTTRRASSSGRYGSPPRPWGRPRPSPGASRLLRFTPTPVGTTVLLARECGRPSVHPHARGDDAIRANHEVCAAGSPPRPWGRRTV